MIIRQAQDLRWRDVGRLVTVTDSTTGRTASGTLAGILTEAGHGWLMIADQDPPLHVRPETIVEVRGTHTQARARDGATMTICDECDVAWPCEEVSGARTA